MAIPFIFTSHEGLFLHHEQALTKPWKPLTTPEVLPSPHKSARKEARDTRWYNGSAHFVWIGDKTGQLEGAHVEYFRGLENPIGIKVGPSMEANELIQLLDIVDPHKEVGKVTLITRLGVDRVARTLGCLIKAVQGSGHVVIWQYDPMHGNTRISSTGIRTRSFSSIVHELTSTMNIHKQHDSRLGGVHLEMTADSVIECVGGSDGTTDGDLGGQDYTTKCDPRLNKRQALELAFLVADHYRDLTSGVKPYPRLKL
jgi:3-deoxy-7-phosphoheptulonate synthase